MKKLVTGTEVRKEEHPITAEYKGKLSDEILNKCLEFDTFYFSLNQGFDNVNEKRSELKHKAEELTSLVNDSNKELFLSYLKNLILRSSNNEFLIPYYMCNELHDNIDSSIVIRHDSHHFGLLGKVDDILGA